VKEPQLKKTTLIIGCVSLLLLGSSSLASGQETGGSFTLPRVGLEGGINLATLEGSTAGDIYESRLGFVGGLFLNFHLGPVLGIQPEVLYEQKGGIINGNTYKLDYVEVPILLDIALLGPLSVLAGPAFNANVANEGVGNVASSDVGLVLGAQIFITNFLVSGRYELGLTDVSTGQNYNNGTFTFMVGLSLI
jgi:hypothetical protein